MINWHLRFCRRPVSLWFFDREVGVLVLGRWQFDWWREQVTNTEAEALAMRLSNDVQNWRDLDWLCEHEPHERKWFKARWRASRELREILHLLALRVRP